MFLFDFKVEGNSISHGLNWCASVFGKYTAVSPAFTPPLFRFFVKLVTKGCLKEFSGGGIPQLLQNVNVQKLDPRSLSTKAYSLEGF